MDILSFVGKEKSSWGRPVLMIIKELAVVKTLHLSAAGQNKGRSAVGENGRSGKIR